MTNTSDYMFNKLTGLGEDQCYLSQTEIQNKGHLDYTILGKGHNMDPTLNIALSNGINYTGGKNSTGLEGSYVDQSNKLLLGSKGTHPHNKLALRERQYMTIPYLGKGSSNIDVENRSK